MKPSPIVEGERAMPDSNIEITFLTDGGQQADDVAGRLATFLRSARQTLDVCIYDANLAGAPGDTVTAALRDAISGGIQVRIAYFSDNRSSGPDPMATFVGPFGDRARPIHAVRGLMHDKYVICDAQSSDAVVWTGSANWTTDSWTRQENVIVTLPSPAMASHYSRDFEEMWTSGAIEGTGAGAGGAAQLSYDGQDIQGTVWFSPSDGAVMSHAVARAISNARQRIVIASPVITDGPILGAILDVLHDGRVPVRGVYDRTQMEEAVSQWQHMPLKTWKIGAFRTLQEQGRLSSKVSTPYETGSVHDYLHVKLVVADDAVFTGSYNLSHNGEMNAENLIRLDSAALADLCAAWIDKVSARYATST